MNINICRGCETVKHCMDSKVKVCERQESRNTVRPGSLYTEQQHMDAALWLYRLTTDQIVALYLKEVFT